MKEIDEMVFKWKQGHARILELCPRMPYELAAKISLDLVRICESPKEQFAFDSHSKELPASQKQIKLMEKLKIPAPENCDMRTAHELIANKLKETQGAGVS